MQHYDSFQGLESVWDYTGAFQLLLLKARGSEALTCGCELNASQWLKELLLVAVVRRASKEGWGRISLVKWWWLWWWLLWLWLLCLLLFERGEVMAVVRVRGSGNEEREGE